MTTHDVRHTSEATQAHSLSSPEGLTVTANRVQSDSLAEKLRAAESMIDALRNERDYLRHHLDQSMATIDTLSVRLADTLKVLKESPFPILPAPKIPWFLYLMWFLTFLALGIGVWLVARRLVG